MKPKGKHPYNALTVKKVLNLSERGRYADGNGLYLVVDHKTAKYWILRTVIKGSRTDLGLGSARLVTLAEARELATQYRKIARAGGDPIAERNRAADIPKFESFATETYENIKSQWKNEKHRMQWINTLQKYAFPLIGHRTVDSMTTADMLKVLEPIWTEKPETARRIKQRLATVMDRAKAKGYFEGENPVTNVALGLATHRDKPKHHRALPFGDVAGFIQDMRALNLDDGKRLGFEFLILTASRTGEVLGATWSEIDLEANTWTIPSERMKAGEAHNVPLSGRCIEIARRAQALTNGNGHIFQNTMTGKKLSNMAFLMTMRRMKVDAVPHGFRSSFRDWAAETTGFPHEVVEMALAHTIKNKVEAAYRRGDLLDKRRKLMEAWASYVGAVSTSKVIRLAR